METCSVFSNADMDVIKKTVENGNYMENIFKDIFNNKNNLFKICDVGCGNGVFTAALKSTNNCYLIGLDGSAYGLEQSKSAGFDETHLVTDLGSNRYPIENNYCDFVICKDLLEHLLMPEHAIAEIFRILKPGGIVLFHVPNHFSLWHRIKFLFTGNIDTQKYFPNSNEWDFPHIRFFSANGLATVLKKNNFELVKAYDDQFAYIAPYCRIIPGAKSLARALARKNPSNFSVGFTCLCKKN